MWPRDLQAAGVVRPGRGKGLAVHEEGMAVALHWRSDLLVLAVGARAGAEQGEQHGQEEDAVHGAEEDDQEHRLEEGDEDVRRSEDERGDAQDG